MGVGGGGCLVAMDTASTGGPSNKQNSSICGVKQAGTAFVLQQMLVLFGGGAKKRLDDLENLQFPSEFLKSWRFWSVNMRCTRCSLT